MEQHAATMKATEAGNLDTRSYSTLTTYKFSLKLLVTGPVPCLSNAWDSKCLMIKTMFGFGNLFRFMRNLGNGTQV